LLFAIRVSGTHNHSDQVADDGAKGPRCVASCGWRPWLALRSCLQMESASPETANTSSLHDGLPDFLRQLVGGCTGTQASRSHPDSGVARISQRKGSSGTSQPTTCGRFCEFGDHAALLVKITPLVKLSAAGIASRKKSNLQADGSNLCQNHTKIPATLRPGLAGVPTEHVREGSPYHAKPLSRLSSPLLAGSDA
jgi:hypothetical protein